MPTLVNHLPPHRPVRSYVRREGRVTPAQSRALEALWPRYGISEHETLLTARKLFGEQRPLTLEIGFGNGQNLVDLALAYPDHGYIGIDVYRSGAGRLMLELDRLTISNVRILIKDAVEALLYYFFECSLDNILIYFPDPWPKKRHHKRRIFSAKFVHDLAFCLKPSGKLYVSTDCRNYAQIILDLIAQEPFLKTLDRTNQNASQLCRKSETKYETRGISLGHPIINILAQRS